jgi:flagellar hook-associated protein 2
LYNLTISASVKDDQIVIEHNNYGENHTFRVKSSVAQGEGGLDIGGATVGVVATYKGVNVAGTINGEAATGSGFYLTGNSGNATTDGLMIKVDATAPGSYGNVKVSQGIASRLQGYVERVTHSTNGSITIATKGIEKDITALDEQIARMEQSLATYLEKLRSQLLAMETAIAQANSLQTYITNQLKGLTTNYGNNSRS